MKTSIRYNILSVLLCLWFVGSTACEDFVKIDPPTTDLVKKTVFSSDENAEAAMLDIYYQLTSYLGFASGTEQSISYLCAIYSDEELNYYTASPEITAQINEFAENDLLPNNTYVLNLWSQMYKCIYKANAIIEALPDSPVSASLKTQLEGEAKFIRAFSYFYLVNLWGAIPLVTSTDYRVNASMGRTGEDEVYRQIVQDLKDAKDLLLNDYSFSNNLRVRANKGAATALLARTYLYMQEWQNAEAQATILINDNTHYSLVPALAEVFRTTSKEVILQWWSDIFPAERSRFSVGAAGPIFGALRSSYANSFEVDDLRRSTWGRSRVVGDVTYYYTLKYLSFETPPLDFSVVMRLSEQYLIRAEARAQLNDEEGARADINIIRHRAGLSDTPASDMPSLLLAIEQERKSEFVNEWGHRWFDLKRTGKANEVLSPLKPLWTSTNVLFPIPEYEIRNNESLRGVQNPGY